MAKTKLLALLLALVMVVGLVAACNNDDGDSGSSGAAGERERYEFIYYRNYDWAGDVWGDDATSRYWSELFNIYPEMQRPDANPDDLLTLMITSGDFPDAIWMERGDWNRRLARDGYLVDLDTLKPLVNNNWYDENILAQTQKHLQIDGVLYGIPNWARKDASGGNNAWMYTQGIYEAVGSPSITVFDDLYNYAVAVRDNVATNQGMPVIPVASEAGDTNGENFVRGIYKSFGGVHDDGWWTVSNGQYIPSFQDPIYQAALLEANKWYREGLILDSMLTDTRDEFLEKLSSARIGLIWYDHSQDDGNNFRKTVRSSYPNESIELITFQGDGMTRIYPPANGLAPGRMYGEHYGTIGWNVTCIFKAAEKPERIFELVTYLLTKQGSIEMMYGPKGGPFWDDYDSNGNPILKINPDDEANKPTVDEYGLWKWTLAGHADNVDHTKFAVNAAQPADQRVWVVSQQSEVFTPLMRPLTDEYANIHAILPPDTPLNIAREACFQYMRERFPQVIRAASEAEARAIIDDVLAFYSANSMAEIIVEHNKVYQENLAMQGGTIFTK